MKNISRLITYLLTLVFLPFACQQENEQPEPEEFGYLSMSISLTIEESAAAGRMDAVNTDDFKVTIFRASDDSEVMSFEPFSSAPPEVQLPTGEYYLEAHSNNLVEGAFDNPYYFGRSDNFTIDKEETKAIDINVELANMKVAINYLPSVTSTFDSYSGSVTVNSSGFELIYSQTETREGYFVVEPVTVEVNLSYTKLDGSTIDRTFTANIDNPQPKTLYTINVDATLEDGVISINIIVDESFEEEVIDLGDQNLDPTLLWIKNYGGSRNDFLQSVIQKSDGTFIYVGSTLSSDGDISSPISANVGFPDAWVINVDQSGVLIWEKTLGGTAQETFHQVIETQDGGLAISGYAYSYDVDLQGVTTASGKGDYWLVKLDGNGNVQWQKAYGGTRNDEAYGLCQTQDGGYILVGTTSSNDGMISQTYGNDDIWVVKVDSQGNLQWERNFGGSGRDEGREIIQLSNGSYLLSGYTYSNDFNIVTGNGGQADGFILNFDQNNVYWSKTIGGSANDYTSFIYEDSDNTILLGTTILSNEFSVVGGQDAFIFRFTESGSIVESFQFDRGGSESIEFISEFQDGYMISGSTMTNIWFMIVDQNMAPIFEDNYGGAFGESGYGAFEITDGFLLTGSSLSSNGDITEAKGNRDYILANLKN